MVELDRVESAKEVGLPEICEMDLPLFRLFRAASDRPNVQRLEAEGVTLPRDPWWRSADFAM